MVAAIRGSEDLSKFFREYQQSIFPSDKFNEKFLAENFEKVSSEFEKNYKVTKVKLPGEE